MTDEEHDVEQIGRFTAMTGSLQGVVACYAECAMRQLFRANGVVMSRSDAAPGKHVDEMIAYAETTATRLKR